MWIWYVSQSRGSASAIADKARNHNFRTVLIKSPTAAAPGRSSRLSWSTASRTAWPAFAPGSSYTATASVAEAQGAEAAGRDGRRTPVRLRAVPRGRPLPRGAARAHGYSYLSCRPASPTWIHHQTFLSRCSAGRRHDERPAGLLAHHRNHRPDRPCPHLHVEPTLRPPDLPASMTYQSPPGRRASRVSPAPAGYDACGVSWWSWQEDKGTRTQIGRTIHGPYPDPPNDFDAVGGRPRRHGAVVNSCRCRRARWRRRDLRQWNEPGRSPLPGRLALAVRDRDATWRKLDDFRAVRINWSQRGNPGFAKMVRARSHLRSRFRRRRGAPSAVIPVAWFWDDLVAQDRQWFFLVLAGFIGSFAFIRMSTRLMRSPRVPWWPGSVVSEGGVHVHHLVFGIVTMMVAGTISFAGLPPARSTRSARLLRDRDRPDDR